MQKPGKTSASQLGQKPKPNSQKQKSGCCGGKGDCTIM